MRLYAIQISSPVGIHSLGPQNIFPFLKAVHLLAWELREFKTWIPWELLTTKNHLPTWGDLQSLDPTANDKTCCQFATLFIHPLRKESHCERTQMEWRFTLFPKVSVLTTTRYSVFQYTNISVLHSRTVLMASINRRWLCTSCTSSFHSFVFPALIAIVYPSSETCVCVCVFQCIWQADYNSQKPTVLRHAFAFKILPSIVPLEIIHTACRRTRENSREFATAISKSGYVKKKDLL